LAFEIISCGIKLLSSPELKAQVSFSDRLLSVDLSVCKLLHFRLLQNHWANFNQTWHKLSLGGGFLNFSNEGDCPSDFFFKSSPAPAGQFQSNFVQIIIKLGTNHPLVKGILNFSNKGPGPLKSGDNYKNALKIFFSRPTEPE
jgi:hypothetical protein